MSSKFQNHEPSVKSQKRISFTYARVYCEIDVYVAHCTWGMSFPDWFLLLYDLANICQTVSLSSLTTHLYWILISNHWTGQMAPLHHLGFVCTQYAVFFIEISRRRKFSRLESNWEHKWNSHGFHTSFSSSAAFVRRLKTLENVIFGRNIKWCTIQVASGSFKNHKKGQ